MSNTYPLEQQIHALSQLTNAGFGQEFPQPAGGPCASPNAFDALQTYVTTVVNDVLTQDQGAANGSNNYLGTSGNAWQCVWGPVVYSNNPTSGYVVADNTIALYYNSSSNSYVAGIAGTNEVSSYGWLDEDFDAGTTVAWNTIVATTQAPSTAAISTGAQVGLNILLNATSAGNTLVQYLQNNVSAGSGNATVYVAGHSLGGALTHIMALYLYETAATWNTGDAVNNITAYPTAGPTITNQQLTQYYEGLLAATGTISLSYKARNNSLDLVPMGWALDTMAAAPYIYDSFTEYQNTQTTPADNMGAMMATAAIMKSYNINNFSFNNYTQIWGSDCQLLTGSYETLGDIVGLLKAIAITSMASVFTGNSVLKNTALVSGNYPGYLVNFIVYCAQVYYQHTTAYDVLLDITDFNAEFLKIRATVPGGSGSTESFHEIAINKLLARVVGKGTVEAISKTVEPAVSVN